VRVVKNLLRVLLAMASGLALLLLLGWISTFFYWHIRITRAIRIRQTQRLTSDIKSYYPLWDAAGVLESAGSRSMPYLVAELNESQHPEFLQCASWIIAWQSLECLHDGNVEWGSRMGGWAYIPDDPSEVRARKFEEMKAWWKTHGAEYHRWWRVWSSKCGS